MIKTCLSYRSHNGRRDVDFSNSCSRFVKKPQTRSVRVERRLHGQLKCTIVFVIIDGHCRLVKYHVVYFICIHFFFFILLSSLLFYC